MSGELSFAAALANPEIRLAIRQYLDDIEWTSPLAITVKDYLTDNHTGPPHISEVRALLSNNFYAEEVDKVINMMKDYMETPPGRLDKVIEQFEKFYQNKTMTALMSELGSGKSVDELIAEVKEIPNISTSNIPIYNISELDVDQVAEEETGGLDTIPTSYTFLQNAMPNRGYSRGQVVMVVAPPGVGKSMWLMNEIVHQLKAGFKVYWVALGDMMRLDFIQRFSGIITNTPLQEVSLNPKKYYTDEVRNILKNFRSTILPAGAIDVQGLNDFIDNRVVPEEDFDIFVLDYDSNLSEVNETSMYEKGGNTYNQLSVISRPLQKGIPYRLVFVASQPKNNYWGEEHIPKDGAAESSRKQQISDMMITLGKSSQIEDRTAGIISLEKNRRGPVGSKSPFIVRPSGKIEEIEHREYTLMKKVTSNDSGSSWKR